MYMWKYELDKRGFVEASQTDYTEEKFRKKSYVESYLSDSIQHSDCGWHHCTYHLLQNKRGIEEFVCIHSEPQSNDGRFVNVSGNSLGAIAEAVWKNIYNS